MAGKPLDIFVIQQDANDEQKKYWRRCGVAFENRDGSMNLKLDLFPDLQMQVRERKEKEDKPEPVPARRR